MAKDFKAFMAENAIKTVNQEYVASKRFVGADGKPIPWELRVVTNKEIEEITKASKKKEFIAKTRDYKVITDTERFNCSLVCASVVYPDLNNAELQDSYGACGAEDLVKVMLTPGEYTDLVSAVSEVCGFQTDMSEKIKAAKN